MLGYFKRHYSKDRHFYKLFYRTLGITPSNIDLYKLALIHRSASVVLDDGSAINNERLEFLGDAVLGAIAASLAFINFPDMPEGILTQIRSKIVNRESMNSLAKKLMLHQEAIVSPPSIIMHQQNILGDAMEALIGAIYLDKGYDQTCKIMFKLIQDQMDLEHLLVTERDFKSRVLEWAQKQHTTIQFVTTNAPNHTEKSPLFQTTLIVDNQQKGFGTGRNKKLSEQQAARQLFESLNTE